MDRVELAVVDVPGPHDDDPPTPGVAVAIGGQALEDLWTKAGGLAQLPIWVSDVFEGGAWLDGAFVGGRLRWRRSEPCTPVVTCTCGFFDCGGGTVRIEVHDDTVTWSEFDQVLGKGRVPIGPFTFARDEYESEIDALERAVRAVRDV